MKRFSHFIVKQKVLVLVIAFLLLIPSVLGMVGTHINYNILSYLPTNLESVIGEKLLENDYKMASTAMVTLEGMPDQQISNLKEEFKKIDGVSNVLWVDDLGAAGIPKDMLPDDIRSIFYGKNDATMMIVTFDDTVSSKQTLDAIAQMKSKLNEQSFIAGMASLAEDTKAICEGEVPIYVAVAVVLLLIILFMSMESTIVPFLFLAGIGCAILYNSGTNYFLGEISFLTQALAAVLQLAVTMDFSIFLLHRYEEEKTQNPDKEKAMCVAIQKTFSSITGSSLTTIAGFLAMCTMSLTLGRDIGIVMAKGVLLGVICTVTILPALIMLFDKQIEKYRHRTLIPKLKHLSHFVTKHYVVVPIVFLILLIPFVYGQQNTKVYYSLLDSMPDTLCSTQGKQKLQDEFGMTTTDFIFVDETLTNAQMKEITNQIEKLDGISQVVSMEKFVGGGIPEDFFPEDLLSLLRQNGKEMMLVNSKYDTASDEQNAQLEQIETILKQYDESALVTGEAPMTKDLISVADVDLRNVSIVSIGAVFLIIAIAFRSLGVPVILVLMIESAITINMGIPYFTGSVLPFIASIVIGTIQLGATIDYAILMTNRFREERINGHTPKEAAQIAVENCSQSILTSGLAFFLATAGVAAISRLELISSLCLLISRGAVISMFVILTVLPCMLILCSKLIEKTSLHWLRAKKS